MMDSFEIIASSDLEFGQYILGMSKCARLDIRTFVLGIRINPDVRIV